MNNKLFDAAEADYYNGFCEPTFEPTEAEFEEVSQKEKVELFDLLEDGGYSLVCETACTGTTWKVLEHMADGTDNVIGANSDMYSALKEALGSGSY